MGVSQIDFHPKSKPIEQYYYSFKIFPRFWLAKRTRIIHHNKLLMTKFGKILCLTRKWRKNAAFLKVNAPLTEKTWGRDWVVLVVETKMADISFVSRVRTRRNNSSKHGKKGKKTSRRATSAIWRIFAELNNPKRALSKTNLTSMDRWR